MKIKPFRWFLAGVGLAFAALALRSLLSDRLSAPEPGGMSEEAATLASSVDLGASAPAPLLEQRASLISRLERRGSLLDERLELDEASGRGKRVTLLELSGKSDAVRVEQDLRKDPATDLYRVTAVREMVANRAIVRLGRSSDLLWREDRRRSLGIVGLRRIGSTAFFEATLARSDLEAVPEFLGQIAQGPKSDLIAAAEPDYVVHATLLPHDPAFADGSLWGLSNVGQSGGVEDVDIDAPEAWERRVDTGEIVIGVIDTGIRYDHEDLSANIWTNADEVPGNGIDDDGNGYVDDVFGINAIADSGDPMDDNGHGTHVAGTIGAVGGNGLGSVGVAWRTRLMGLKFLDASGSGAISDAIECVDYAARKGAKVLNASWGGGGYSQALEETFRVAESMGVVIVAAAGNEGRDVDVDVNYPSGYLLDNVLSVASMDRDGDLSDFSNYGIESVDIAAPGGQIYSCWHESASSYATISGTSMATPHVSAALALLMAEYPGDDYRSQINRLLYSSDRRDSLIQRIGSGGSLNLDAALSLSEVPFPPVFRSRPPAALTRLAGNTESLAADVESVSTLRLQWYKDGSLLEGETRRELSFLDLTPADSGTYRLNAANDDGEVDAWTELRVVEPQGYYALILDAEDYDFASYGDARWLEHALDAVEGGVSLRSGDIEDGETSSLITEVQGPGQVRFDWRLSAESYFDIGEFRVDGVLQERAIVSGDWSSVVADLVENRNYRLVWTYRKDLSLSSGSDSLFLDRFSFTPLESGPPIIVQQPRDLSITPGASLSLEARALGASLTYQWYRNGIALPDATASNWLISEASSDDDGVYWVVVRNEGGDGVAESRHATVRVEYFPIEIVASPRDQSLQSGASALFEVGVIGSEPIRYQWYKDGEPLEGERAETLRLDNLTPSMAGRYFVSVSNDAGRPPVASSEAILSVQEVRLGPRIVKSPQSGRASEGEGFSFSSLAEGSAPILYQWFKDGVALDGKTSRSLELGSVQESDAGAYYVEASNRFGRVTSSVANLVVLGNLGEALDQAELSWTIEGDGYYIDQNEETWDGEDALRSAPSEFFLPRDLSLKTTVSGPTNFRLHWKMESSLGLGRAFLLVDGALAGEISGNTDWSEAIAPVGGGEHQVEVLFFYEAGDALWLDSVRLDPSPVFFEQARSQILLTGDVLRLQAKANGAAPLTYQWFRFGEPLAGETGEVLDLGVISPALLGDYSLEASNAHGTRSSEVARIELLDDFQGEITDGSLEIDLDSAYPWRPHRVDGDIVLRSPGIANGLESGFEAFVEDGGTLQFSYRHSGPGCCSRIQLWVNGTLFRSFDEFAFSSSSSAWQVATLQLPEGASVLRWVFQGAPDDYAEQQFAEIDDLRLSQAPILTTQPRDSTALVGGKSSFAVAAVGREPLSYQWLRDGSEVPGATGRNVSFAAVAASDAGRYVCRVSDVRGLLTESEGATLSVITGLPDALDTMIGRFRSQGAVWQPTSEESWDGVDAAAVRLEGEATQSVLWFDVDLPPGERRALAFRMKIQGNGGRNEVAVFENGRKKRYFPENLDWTEVVMPLGRFGANTLTWQLYRREGSESEPLLVWLDSFELREAPAIYDEPESLGLTYGGSGAVFIDAVGREDLAYSWKKDGLDLDLADPLLAIDGARFGDVGRYSVEVANAAGTAVSQAVDVVVLEQGFREAVGLSGRAVSASGSKLWSVDREVFRRGAAALRAGELGADQSSRFSAYFRGPGILEFDWKLESPSGADRLYLYADDALITGLFRETEWSVKSFELGQEGYLFTWEFFTPQEPYAGGGKAWLDGIRFRPLPGVLFDDWLAETPGLPAGQRGPFDDPDGDGLANFAEYALRMNPLLADPLPIVRYEKQVNGYALIAEFPVRRDAADVAFGLEVSDDLKTWRPLDARFIKSSGTQAFGILIYDGWGDQPELPIHARFAVYWTGGDE